MSRPLPTLAQLRLRDNQLFLALSIIVGILAGLAAVLFSLSIDRATRELFGLEPSAARLFLVPAGVSLVTGMLLAWVFPEVRGSGIPQTEAAYHLNGGRIPGRVAIGKFITGVLCVGSGHSMGREGPSVQIGAALASTVGRWVGVTPDRVKALVPVGAAGALSAAFNTPVAAVLFSIEEIIGSMSAPVIGSAVVASVASVVVERSILGNEPLFHVPEYQLVHPAELAAYAALGVVGGVVSIVFCRALLAARAGFRQLPARTRVLQPAMGGVIIGLILLVRPEVMGVGYEYVDQALNGNMVLRGLVLLCLVKMVATIVSYASGNAGGIFAPTLFLGAMAGGAVGSVVHAVAPFPTASPGAYALVGMGTLFAGIIRAPMTSVFMVFEITQDYQILVPLMVANLLSFVISRRFQPTPVYHALLHQDGVHLPTAGELAPEDGVSVGDVMSPAAALPSQMAVHSAASRLQADGTRRALVTADGRLLGIVSRDAVVSALEAGKGEEGIGSLAQPPGTHLHPDHRIHLVFERWPDADGLLPVVARDDASRLVGMITLQDMLRFLAADSPDPVGGPASPARSDT
ncbi:MAG: chloride channel protein [Vicinamibacterales bacterium]